MSQRVSDALYAPLLYDGTNRYVDDDEVYLMGGAPSKEAPKRPSLLVAAGAYAFYAVLVVVAAIVAAGIASRQPGGMAIEDVFDEARALTQLQELVDLARARNGAEVAPGLFGVTGRLAFDESGLLTVGWLTAALNKINADALARDPAARQLEIRTSQHGGVVVEDDEASAVWYTELTNVAVRLPGASESAVLVSAHYDSVVYSPGASDNAAAVVTVLELLRELLSTSDPLPYTLIAIFDDAEESGLLGIHAFIEEDPWMPSVRAHVNLDSAGGWRLAMLTQMGPENSWLGRAYSGVPFPQANVIVADIFALLASATNFELLAKSNTPGYDIDFYEDGYMYHTDLDDLDDYVCGTLQALGRNTRSILYGIAAQAEFENGSEPEGSIATFFDILSSAFVTYSAGSAQIIAAILVFVCVLIFAFAVVLWAQDPLVERSHIVRLTAVAVPVAYVGMLLTALATAAMAIVAGLVSDAIKPNSWYSSPIYTTFLFGSFCFLGMVAGAVLVAMAVDKLLPEVSAQCRTRYLFTTEMVIVFAASGVHITFMLLFTAIDWGTAYIFVFWVVCYMFAILPAIALQHRAHSVPPSSSSAWLIALVLYAVWAVFPLLLNADVLRRALVALVPQTNRFGHTSGGGLFMGAMFGLMGVMVCMPLAPLMSRAQHKVKLLVMVFLLSSALLVSCIGFEPYTERTPERVDIIHMYDADTSTSRITLGVPHPGPIPTDQFTPSRAWEPCAVPVYKYDMREDGYCLAETVPAPNITLPTVQVTNEGAGVLRVRVTAEGSAVWVLKFSGDLVAWSLSESVPPAGKGGRVALDETERAIVKRGRSGVSEFSLTFDTATTSAVEMELWANYLVQSAMLRDTINALNPTRQVWGKSNMPGPTVVLKHETFQL